jgi:hypothetical protein
VAVFDIFSKRQKSLRGEVPDVYTYGEIPQPLRVQIIQIWQAMIGEPSQYGSRSVDGAYKSIVEALRHEYGVFRLPGAGQYDGHFPELCAFLLHEEDIERVLDAVEISFRIIDRVTSKFGYASRSNAEELAEEAIHELNDRFKEHGVGYQYADGGIIRVDSQFVHSEVVKPALALLRAPQYAGAQAEFLKAHEHYRQGNSKEALAECLKALESVMKAICEKRQWSHPPQATSKALIQVCLDNGLIPSFWDQHFEPHRLSWRLQPLRGWSHEQHIKEVSSRSPGASRADGPGTRGGI